MESVLLNGIYDALYAYIFTGVEDIEPILDVLSFVFFSHDSFHYIPFPMEWPGMIEKFLSLQTGDVELYLGDSSSLLSI